MGGGPVGQAVHDAVALELMAGGGRDDLVAQGFGADDPADDVLGTNRASVNVYSCRTMRRSSLDLASQIPGGHLSNAPNARRRHDLRQPFPLPPCQPTFTSWYIPFAM